MKKHYCDNCEKECEPGSEDIERGIVLQPGNVGVKVTCYIREPKNAGLKRDLCGACCRECIRVLFGFPKEATPTPTLTRTELGERYNEEAAEKRRRDEE